MLRGLFKLIGTGNVFSKQPRHLRSLQSLRSIRLIAELPLSAMYRCSPSVVRSTGVLNLLGSLEPLLHPGSGGSKEVTAFVTGSTRRIVLLQVSATKICSTSSESLVFVIALGKLNCAEMPMPSVYPMLPPPAIEVGVPPASGTLSMRRNP